MRHQTITMSISGKTDSDLELAREEIFRKLKDGYTSGADRNESGRYSFEVTSEITPMAESEISDEANRILNELPDSFRNERTLRSFALSKRGLDFEDVGGYIPNNVASLIQAMLNEWDAQNLIRRMNDYFDIKITV